MLIGHLIPRHAEFRLLLIGLGAATIVLILYVISVWHAERKACGSEPATDAESQLPP